MPLETNNKPLVRFSDNVNSYFEELIEALFWQDYFGFIESALQYVVDMKNFIETYISVLPAYPALPIFRNTKKECSM